MNMRRDRMIWELKIVAILVGVSLLLYLIHFICFRNLQHICLWSFTSLAFLPISALVVTLVINRVLSARDKALRMDKLNMLIGVFFSNVGNELLIRFSDWDANAQNLRNNFGTPKPWASMKEKDALIILNKHQYTETLKTQQLVELKTFLAPRVDFLMRLIENPSLLEHENFTQLLRAVFHLAEELSYRNDLESTPDKDIKHLTGDIERAYKLLMREWILYMIFLKHNFPFLFSLAIRTNPFDKSAVAIIS